MVTKQEKRNDVAHWCRVIERQYQDGQHTWGPCTCPECDNSARGGYYCASCAEKNLADIVGSEMAEAYCSSVITRHKMWMQMMEIIDGKK